jgi:hypothetical protein
MLVYVLVWNDEDFLKLVDIFSAIDKTYRLVPIYPSSESSHLYEYYRGGVNIQDPIELQTYIGHLKMVRAFLETEENECLICEDFIRLDENFHEKFTTMKANIPKEIGLVSLAHEAEEWNSIWTGILPEEENLCSISPDVYGSACYYLKASWATDILKFFDKPFNRMPESQRDVETFVKYSAGYLSYPTLAFYGSMNEEEEIDGPKGSND